MLTNLEEESTRMYNELEGFNLFQLFSLNEGKGKKPIVKQCNSIDKLMNEIKLTGGLEKLRKSVVEKGISTKSTVLQEGISKKRKH